MPECAENDCSVILVGAVIVSVCVDVLFAWVGSVWSAVTVAVFETIPDAPGTVKIESVAVVEFAIVPSRHVTVPPASEHEPCVVLADRYVTTEGRVSATVTFVADVVALLFVTVRVYVSRVPSVTGFGVPVFTIDISTLLAVPTTTVALAVLLVMLGTMLVAEAVAVSVMFVPEGVTEFTCSTRLKFAVFGVPTPRVPPSVQVIVTPPPGADAVPQVHPPGGVIDTNVVFGGVVCVNVIPAVATAGPLFVTLWV